MNLVTAAGTGNDDLEGTEPRRWVRLTVRLREQATDGTLAPGTPLPSIKTLVQETGYSRQTCGKALRQLEREGLIARIPGLGYYVTGRPCVLLDELAQVRRIGRGRRGRRG